MHHKNCGLYTPHEHSERLSRMTTGKTIFACGDGDIAFANPSYMEKVFDVMRNDVKASRTWIIQSKNPSCFEQYLKLLPMNTYLLTTIETNRDTGYGEISKAPMPSLRYEMFRKLDYPRKILTIEPIMDFDIDVFLDWILSINPVAVFIGYNSRPNPVKLTEPTLPKTIEFINLLKQNDINVLTKDMKEKSNEFPKMAYRDLFEHRFL